jgi:predicted NBD/HSP70 family sugar kinase
VLGGSPQGTGLRVSSKAARRDTRSTNRRLILQHLFGGDLLSRADLARRTKLTPATVSTLVSELENVGLINETNSTAAQPRVGKPPTMLQIRAEARSIVALDLGDPEVLRAGVIDLVGNITDRTEVAVAGKTGEAVVELVETLVIQTIAKAQTPVLGVGIGTPGVVSTDGTLIEATAFGWHHVDMRGHIQASVDAPTYVTNDANAAALAEYSRGGHDSSHLAVVKIGSGIGAGFVLNGHLFQGEHAGAGEIGHLVVDPGGPECRCGHHGCLETFVSTPIVERALASGGADAASIRRSAAERLGIALASVVAILDLDHILIAGPPNLLRDDFCDMVTASLRTRCLKSVAESVNVRQTSLGDDVVLLGAAGFVLSQELGVA